MDSIHHSILGTHGMLVMHCSTRETSTLVGSMVGRAAATAASGTSNAALQLRCTTPKRTVGKPTAKHFYRGNEDDDDDHEPEADVRSSRYRLLDEREQQREKREIERIKREILAQRRPRSASRSVSESESRRRPSSATRSRPSQSRDADSPPPYNAVASSSSSLRTNISTRPHTSAWYIDEDDLDDPFDEVSDTGDEAVVPLPTVSVSTGSTAFQEQVLKELQKLKQAQQQDLAAIQRLQREKEEAERRAKMLEAALQRQRQPQVVASDTKRSRPRAPTHLEFDDHTHGDESVAPDALLSPSSPPTYDTQKATDHLDVTDGEEEEEENESREWACRPRSSSQPRRNRCSSPSITRKSRPQSARSERSYSSHTSRPGSARLLTNEDEAGEVMRRRSRSGSSASRDEMRRSCAFFEAKQRALEEEAERERETQERLTRAARATPPANLLKRQAEAQAKKQQQIQLLEKERMAELSPAKRVKAREVPMTTYTADASFAIDEAARRERVTKRSQDLLGQAALPSRMKLAEAEEQLQQRGDPAIMSVKMRRRLQEEAEAQAKRQQLMKPKPVPNFNHLQHQWEKALSIKKARHKPTEPQAFFSAREQEIAKLQAKKEERKRKMLEQELAAQREEEARQQILLEKVKKQALSAANDGPKLTKATELRMKKTQEQLRLDRRAKEKEAMERERAELRVKQASHRVAAQVKHLEAQRKGDDYVKPTSVERLAKEKAKKQREEFRAAVLRNKQKLLEAVATKPSLMERFTMDLKREEHKKQALETVVKQVFRNNLKSMKGILTEEEEELAKDIVAADDADDAEADAAEDGGHHAKKKKKKSADIDDDEENRYDEDD